jgi:murein DD-endopeptidase MepM/ murein hydrolase activator NlpD
LNYVGIFYFKFMVKIELMDPLEAFLLQTHPVKVVDASIGYDKYIPLDLSVSNPELSHFKGDAAHFENEVENYLRQRNASVAYGGYLEERNLYKRSAIFTEAAEERSIHIGLDLWISAGTAVLAALDGTIHSFADNKGLGNYGPTIVLKHTFEDQFFYTLYGHLSLRSLAGLESGQVFKQGQSIGTLGDATVNGDYAPHLHFQLIRDVGDYTGDYPGVCSKKDVAFYRMNCPDPNLLLKIKQP